MSLDQAVRNVQILLVSVLAMLVIKGPNVTLLVGVLQLGLAARHVISLLVNVLAILDTREPHVTPVIPTTTKKVMVSLVQVSLFNSLFQVHQIHLRVHIYFQPVDVMLLDQVVYNVRTQLVHVPAMLDTRVPNVTLHVVVIPLVQVVHHVIRLLANVLVILDTQEPHVTLVTPTTIQQVLEQLVQVSLSNS